MTWNTATIEEFEQVVQEILKTAISSYAQTDKKQACVLCLQGDLGAGKTTATQIIARELGVGDTLQSPTFVIRKSYSTLSSIFKILIHMDAYRLEGDTNLKALRLDEDFKTSNTLMVIEWPEIIESIIPENAIRVLIEHANGGRIITYRDSKKQTD